MDIFNTLKRDVAQMIRAHVWHAGGPDSGLDTTWSTASSESRNMIWELPKQQQIDDTLISRVATTDLVFIM